MPKSKYKKIYCRELIDHMKSGYSIESFCAVIDVTRDTLHRWALKYPEFRDAYSMAMSYSAAYWENKLIEIAEKGDFRAIKFALEKIHSRQYGPSKDLAQVESNYKVDTGIPQISYEDEEDNDI